VAEATSTGCAAEMQTSYPKAAISNGPVQAVLYLPDAKNGYYRASRFDWSGVIPCLAYKGHTYFGVWFSHYESDDRDAITGPVEEFRSADGALDYDQAKPGGLFVKIGVGVLRKAEDSLINSCTPIPWWMAASGPCAPAAARYLSGNSCNRPSLAYDYEKTVRSIPMSRS